MLWYSEVIIYHFVQIKSVLNKLFKFLLAHSFIFLVSAAYVGNSLPYVFSNTEIQLSGKQMQAAGTWLQFEIVSKFTWNQRRMAFRGFRPSVGKEETLFFLSLNQGRISTSNPLSLHFKETKCSSIVRYHCSFES